MSLVEPASSTPRLILASASPQRSRLLSYLGIDFLVMPVDCHEDLEKDESAEVMVERICKTKMQAAHDQFSEFNLSNDYILCADTLVSLEHHRLGKPQDRDQARDFMNLLSGKTHQVLTGLCLRRPGAKGTNATRYLCSENDVTFRHLSEPEIEWYLDSNEWDGAAGGYRIQERGASLIHQIQGSWTGIVGFPLEIVSALLRENGLL